MQAEGIANPPEAGFAPADPATRALFDHILARLDALEKLDRRMGRTSELKHRRYDQE